MACGVRARLFRPALSSPWPSYCHCLPVFVLWYYYHGTEYRACSLAHETFVSMQLFSFWVHQMYVLEYVHVYVVLEYQVYVLEYVLEYYVYHVYHGRTYVRTRVLTMVPGPVHVHLSASRLWFVSTVHMYVQITLSQKRPQIQHSLGEPVAWEDSTVYYGSNSTRQRDLQSGLHHNPRKHVGLHTHQRLHRLVSVVVRVCGDFFVTSQQRTF